MTLLGGLLDFGGAGRGVPHPTRRLDNQELELRNASSLQKEHQELEAANKASVYQLHTISEMFKVQLGAEFQIGRTEFPPAVDAAWVCERLAMEPRCSSSRPYEAARAFE